MNKVELKRTPLFECHVEGGAKLVDFAGWEMPVQYSGVLEEHRAVRERAGLFDVSHMGEFRVLGPEAESFLQKLTPNDVSRLTPGRAHYSGLLTDRGTYIDDLLVYRLDDDEFLLVVNAANIEKDFAWVNEHAEGDVEVIDASSEFALLALQGPRAVRILGTLTETDLNAIRYYRFAKGEVAGCATLISRTGYTGEDGFELYLAPEDAPNVWRELVAAGQAFDLRLAGLGARDTLRLEAGMALYGHEIDETTTPFEAALSWVVKLEAGEFVGRDALIEQRTHGVDRSLVGFELSDRGIARQGHQVRIDGTVVGEVTSGTWSPTLEKAIGMAYVPVDRATVGNGVEIDVRGRLLAGRIVPLPFYSRPK